MMPNWAYSDLVITGKSDALDQIEKTKFDFNKIIPPPQPLLDDCEAYCAVCKTRDNLDLTQHNKTCKKCNIGENIGGRVGHTGTDKERYSQLNKDEIKLAKGWRKKYGTDSWYEWNCDNWGTKWDASEIIMERESPTELSVKFQTAWSPPEPIFMKLVEKYNVRIEGEFETEGYEETYNETYGDI